MDINELKVLCEKMIAENRGKQKVFLSVKVNSLEQYFGGYLDGTFTNAAGNLTLEATNLED